MDRTKYGLRISIDELKQIAKLAEKLSRYGVMDSYVYITSGENPEIKQYSIYGECFPYYYTKNV